MKRSTVATVSAILLVLLMVVVDRVAAEADPETQGQTVSVPPSTPSPTEPLPFDEPTVERFFTAVKSQLRCGYPMFGVPSLVPLKISYTLKTSFDLLSLKKISVIASNISVHGLNEFSWDPSRTRFTRTSATVPLSFPNVTAFAQTSINGVNGTSFLELRNITVRLDAQYEEKDDLLYVTDLGGSILLEDAKVKIASLFPKSAKLSKIWNKAIGKSLPILVELFNGGKLKIEYLSRLLSGAKFYAMNTINNALNSHSLNFDRLIESMVKFADGTSDSLQCDGTAPMAGDELIGWLRA
uniref:Lipid-binding serum glycoprotein N-terminal domain-containing protein n=1 Tax=Anopheles funestus TaxID=62324 RepID=A0A182R7L1_ANOFN